jgi:hypothetical protein
MAMLASLAGDVELISRQPVCIKGAQGGGEFLTAVDIIESDFLKNLLDSK